MKGLNDIGILQKTKSRENSVLLKVAGSSPNQHIQGRKLEL